MGQTRYIIRLSDSERKELGVIVTKGSGGAHRIRHAQILLHSDEGHEQLTGVEIAALLHCTTNTVSSVRKRCVEQGMLVALERKKRDTPPGSRLFDGEAEARLLQVACSAPPHGRARWTLQLLSDKVVALQIVPHCTANTIHEVLKKTK
jgi:hypothetical protein